MSAISKRLFGSNIPPEISSSLAQKQLVAEKPQPGEALDQIQDFQTFKTGDSLGVGQMSAQTPFIRMWLLTKTIKKI